VSGAFLLVGNTFRFTEKGFCLPKIQPFYQIQRYTVYSYAFLFFSLLGPFYISVFLSLFLGCFFFGLRMLFAMHFARSRQTRNNENGQFPGKLTKD